MRCRQGVSSLPRVLIQPRSVEAYLLRQRGVKPGSAVVGRSVPGKVLLTERSILRDRRISKVDCFGHGVDLRRKACEEPEAVLHDRAANAKTGLKDAEGVFLRLVELCPGGQTHGLVTAIERIVTQEGVCGIRIPLGGFISGEQLAR